MNNVKIPKKLINDKQISPECIWLIIYFISMDDGYIISKKEIREQTGRGRKYVETLFDSALHSGYLIKTQEPRNKGSFGKITYHLNKHKLFSEN